MNTMRKLSRVLIGLCCLLGTLAFAQSPPKCNSGPKAGWTASDKLSKLLETKGYKFRRIGDMGGCYVVVGTSPEAFGRHIDAELVRWKDAVQASGAKLE